MAGIFAYDSNYNCTCIGSLGNATTNMKDTNSCRIAQGAYASTGLASMAGLLQVMVATTVLALAHGAM
jgi:hypothetical protein